jgi:rhodanese-related sulfurtransferase
MKTILAKDLNALLTHDDQGRVLLVDVRELDEVAEAPLLPPGTPYYVNLPLSVLRMLLEAEVRMRFEELTRRAGLCLGQARVVLSCRSGGRSSRAQEICLRSGVETENLEGGYLAWQKAKENEAAR